MLSTRDSNLLNFINNPSFFWERSGNKSRSRFNLLLLEHNECFFEDYSVIFFADVPEISNKSTWKRSVSTQSSGRLKLCSKSLVFEPEEIRRPLLRMAYRSIVEDIKAYSPGSSKQDGSLWGFLCSESSGFFSITCSSYLEMKGNDKIGPYRQVDSMPPSTFLFSLLHTELEAFLEKLRALVSINRMFESQGKLIAEKELSSYIKNASHMLFDHSILSDFHENLILNQAVRATMVKPLVTHPGLISLTNKRLYFQPAKVNNFGDRGQDYVLAQIDRVYKRRYVLRQIGLEIILKDGKSVLFSFESAQVRDHIYNEIIGQNENLRRVQSLQDVVRKWQRKEISNFEYLMFLNNEADRSLHDLTQYPVFPHVLSDYFSNQLNYDNPNIYRDLSKPVGALNIERLDNFKARFHSMPPADLSMGIPPPFLYGTHYSTPAYVLYFLVRIAPEHMLCLQNGKFDASDRMFFSVKEMWESCLVNATDLKELIPEFFIGNGEFLVNKDDLDLGYRHTGERLNDVELPPWAKNPKDFIRKCKKALESDHVSNNLHKWIDLIFGYKQQGEAAIAADNLFYYLTYEGSVDVEKVTDTIERKALEIQIQEFGQTPKQLFCGPHPCRSDLSAPIPICPGIVKDHIGSSSLNSASTSSTASSSSSSSTLGTSNTLQSSSSTTPSSFSSLSSLKPPLQLGKGLFNSSNSNAATTDMGNNNDAVSGAPPVESKVASIFSLFSGMSSKNANRAPSPSSMSSIASKQTGLSSSSNTSTTTGPIATVEENSGKSKNSVSNTTSSSKVVSNEDNLSSVEKTKAASSSTATTNESISLTMKSSSMINSNSSLPLTPRQYVTRIQPMDCLQVHTEVVSQIAIGSHGESSSLLIATSSEDALLKVVQYSASDSKIVPYRTFNHSDPPLTGCVFAFEDKVVFASSLDNNIHCYSIQNARILSKTPVHEDGVTCLAVRSSFLLTGCLDGVVRLFSFRTAHINQKPCFEWTDHEVPISAVAISEDGQYVVAGSEEGKIIVWNTEDGEETLSYNVSKSGKITSLQFIVLHDNATGVFQRGFSPIKVVCASMDGYIQCIDIHGRLFAATQVNTGVRSIHCDGYTIFGGCDDGSVRVWMMEGSSIKEQLRYPGAHIYVNAISFSKSDALLFTGGSEGNLKVWSVKY